MHRVRFSILNGTAHCTFHCNSGGAPASLLCAAAYVFIPKNSKQLECPVTQQLSTGAVLGFFRVSIHPLARVFVE